MKSRPTTCLFGLIWISSHSFPLKAAGSEVDTMAALDLPKLQDGSVADARALMESMAAAGRERLPPMTASLRF